MGQQGSSLNHTNIKLSLSLQRINMQKKMGFNQKQCYGDEGMRMDARSEEESYFFQEESWSFDNNNHHKQHPPMHMNRLGAYEQFAPNQPCNMGGNFQEPVHNYHGFSRAGGRRLPYGGSGGDGRLNPGGQHHEYFSEQTKYEESYTEEHKGEMRYHQNNWGGETCYDRKYKPRKVLWTTQGI